MGIFFKDGATRKEKAWTLGLYVALACMALGLYSNILVNEAILKPLTWFAGAASIIGVVYPLRALFINNSKLRNSVKAQNRKTWVMALGILVGIPLLCFGFLAKGLPTALHYAFAKPGNMVVVVKHPASSYASSTCTGGVYIAAHSFLNNEICGLQRKDWEALQAGTIIRLVGKKSVFGFTYKGYQIVQSQPS